MTAASDIVIREITSRDGIGDWLQVPHRVFDGDPHWVPPLHLQETQRIDPRQSPFFSFGEAAFFVATRNGTPVGRISAQLNRRALAAQGDDTGHFGFFDCIDDPAVAAALTARAEAFLAAKGMRRVLGPFNLTINEDTGLLVAGFDSPPAILSSHARSWSGGLLEACGYRKAMDLLAYRMRPQSPPATLSRLAGLAHRSGRVRVRPFDMRRYKDEIALLFDIFNDAWSDNWGFVPVSDAEISALIRETRPIMRAKFGRIAEIDGVPAAMIVALPDLNGVIKPFGGKLLPFNWTRLVYAVLADRWRTARIPLLGIRKAHRTSPLSAAVLSLLVSEMLQLGRGYDLDWVEFSWVLETNRQMVALAELAAGPASKTYRVYEKALA